MVIKGVVKSVLEEAMNRGATDIHIVVGTYPTFRINKELISLEKFDIMKREELDKLIETVLDKDEYELLLKNKVYDTSFSVFGVGRFRANFYSQRNTFAITFRILPFEIPSLEQLKLPSSIRKFANTNKGLYLVTGTTGSGKSTTLASIVDLINKEQNCHIVTIEDPIEYLHTHKQSIVTQREVNLDSPSYAEALKTVLRSDPDVIMIGEIRDLETMSIALTAAETGHLVLSTLHTVGVAKSIDRIIDTFPSEQQAQARGQLATVLGGVVTQQLIPSINDEGLVVATEVMFVNSAIRTLIREGKQFQIDAIVQTGSSQGMHSLESDLVRLVREKKITEDMALSRAKDIGLIKQLLNVR